MRGEGGTARRRTVAVRSRAVAIRDEPDALVVGGSGIPLRDVDTAAVHAELRRQGVALG